MSVIRDNRVNETVRNFDSIQQDRLLTFSNTLAEIATYEGNRFYAEFDEDFAIGETKYVIYQMPNVASDKIVALQSRAFKTFTDSASIEILWDSTGITTGASIPSFNENRNSSKIAEMAINKLTAPPTTDGTVRERDFIPEASGPGQASSGGINTDLGFRLYSPDSFFILKVINGSTAQRIHVAYTWYELPSQDFA